jgi:hypothetical protein
MEPRGIERRQSGRLHLSLGAEVVADGNAMKVVVKDLSRGGARFLCSTPPGAAGTDLVINLPVQNEPALSLPAQIVRATATHVGHLVGVRFVELTEEQQIATDAFLRSLLSGSGGEARSHPRVSRRVPLKCPQLGDGPCMLDRISMGGLSLLSNNRAEVGQEISVALPDGQKTDALTLTARVTNVRPSPEGEVLKLIIGAAFHPMSNDKRATLDHLISAWM